MRPRNRIKLLIAIYRIVSKGGKLMVVRPPVDVVKVVKCKDCAFKGDVPDTCGYCYCSRNGYMVKNNDFCSNGCRKE